MGGGAGKLGQHEEVEQVAEGGVIGDGAREGHLTAIDKAAEAERIFDRQIDDRARNAHGPGRLFAEESVDQRDIELRAVGADLEIG